jgi:transcription elongation factor Elf1
MLEFYEKCPNCGSLSCSTDISSDDRKTTCSTCGFSGNITTFRNHDNIEINKWAPKDIFGKQQLNMERADYKKMLMKNLDIKC